MGLRVYRRYSRHDQPGLPGERARMSPNCTPSSSLIGSRQLL